MELYYEGQCCTDCCLFLANGDIPDERPKLLTDIQAQWPDTSYHLCNGDSGENGEHDEEFSWTVCDCCGSSLGGARYPFTVLKG